MRLGRLSISTVAVALVVSVAVAPSWSAVAPSWSAGATLRTCAPASEPKVVFPLSSPSTRSGRGAILWLGGAPNCSGGGSTSTTLDSATLHNNDLASAPRAIISGRQLVGPLSTAATTAGQIVAVVGDTRIASRGGPGAILGEGPAASSLWRLVPLGGPAALVATAVGYIGDAAVAVAAAMPGSAQAILLYQQRHYASAFSGPITLTEGSAPITALTVALDFRADSIVLWAQAGVIHAQWITNAGRVYPAEVLGPAGYHPQIAAMLSDNNHAFAMWSYEPPPGADGPSTIYLEHSGNNSRVAFSGQPSTLVQFTEPPALRLTPGSLALERMTPSEGVLAVWTFVQRGSYVVNVAGLVSSHALPAATLAQRGADLRLAAVATGPHNDAVAVIERAPRAAAGFNATAQAILAARTVPGGPGGTAFETPTPLAPPGPNSAASVAVDPATDRAVVAWQTIVGGLPSVAYAVRGGP
jgi:hypothetical protein